MNPLRLGAPRAQPAARASSGPARFALAGRLEVPIREPSDVAPLSRGGGFLIVSDRSDDLLVLRPDGRATKVDLPGIKGGCSSLEAVAYDPRTMRLFVVSEDKGVLSRFRFDPARMQVDAESRCKLGISGKQNKGVEGMVFLSGADSPTGVPTLLVAKEGKPRALALVAPDGHGEPQRLELDERIKEACGDFSALARDPLSGRIFVGSDESSTIAELRLVRRSGVLRAELVAATVLRDDKGRPLERIEGLAFDARGDLHVLLEDRHELLRFARR